MVDQQDSPRPQEKRKPTDAEVDALASDVRLRIIRLTAHRPLTNKEIAHRLAKDPATTLHHVRKLVDTGFLVAQAERRGNRGAREIPYQSTHKSLTLDITGDRTGSVREAILKAFLGEVAEVGVDSLVQSRLVVQLDEAGQAELRARLDAVLDDFKARPPDPDGERVAIYQAVYPGR
jgi:DNA-binding transcriptional ArsR family regulator